MADNSDVILKVSANILDQRKGTLWRTETCRFQQHNQMHEHKLKWLLLQRTH